MFSAADHAFMARALRLAEFGLFTTSPNPRVGCVVVKDNVIIGEGWHFRAGEPHAEIHALRAAGTTAQGATVYVTLEPCSHHGRVPPCAEALIAAGVQRVVAAMADPDPRVSGRGLEKLAAAGITVDCGLLETEARELNIGFISRMTRGRPWVRLKAAASLDGKTALNDGQSQWITGAAARQDGHRWRARASAILTGIGTVRSDDPQLTVRNIETPRQPLKVVVDSKLELSPQARLLDGSPVLVATASEDAGRIRRLHEQGAEVIILPDSTGAGTVDKVDLPALMLELGRRGINELHVEAGLRLNGALLELGLVDELLLYLAPCLIGDSAHGLFGLSAALTSLETRKKLKILDGRQIGDDFRLRARFV